jgi:hypothetical protein
MTRISPPDRGQPLDVSYIYQLATTLNELADSVSTATAKYATVNTRDAGSQSMKTAETKFYAGYYDVVNNETVTVGQTKPFSITFNSDFKYAPIAVATPMNTGTSVIGNDVSAIITSITTSRVDGLIRFNSAGSVSVSVNVIAIGVPA